MKAASQFLILGGVLFEYFDGHQPVQPMAARLVDDRHSTCSDDLQDFVSIVKQFTYVFVHKKLLTEDSVPPGCGRRSAVISKARPQTATRMVVTLSGAPALFAIVISRWQQLSRSTPCTTSNNISCSVTTLERPSEQSSR